MRGSRPARIYCLAAGIGLALASTGCGSAGVSPPLGPQALEVALLQGEPPTHYMVQITNKGQIPVAVCPCIGPPTRFVVFELYYEDENRSVPYPELLYPDNRLRRFYRCLEPGESLSVEVDLQRWEPVWGGQGASFPRLNLLAGPGSYRVRARYSDTGEVSRRGCAGFQGRVESEWVDFEAPGSGPAQ